MQAERSNSTPTPPAAPTSGAARKGNAKPTDANASASANASGASQGAQDVFASLLAALGDDGLAGGLQSDVPMQLPLGGAVQELPAVHGLVPAPLEGGASGGKGDDVVTPLAVTALDSPTVHAGVEAALAWVGLGGVANTLVAQTAQMDLAADRTESSEKDALGLLGAKAKGPQARWASASAAWDSRGGTQPADTATLGRQAPAASALAGVAGAQPAPASAGAQAADMQSAAREGATVALQGAASAQEPASGPLLQALQAALQEQRGSSAAAAEPVARTAPEGAAGGALAADLAPGAPDAAAPDASALAGEDSMAEQVAFWVNQNSQSAEMTLDRDGQPMQVRVALSGSEAHVTFRSDQVQTREALDASMSQLRELLQSQGLVLAGVTVGDGAGAGGGAAPQSGQPGGEGRAGARAGRAQVAPAQAVAAGTSRTPVAGARGLDVFV